jgi:transposase
LAVDKAGTPLACVFAKGPASEIKLAPQVLDRIAIVGSRGRPRKRFGKLLGDRAYDSKAFRKSLRSKGVIDCIPRRVGKGQKSLSKHSGPRGYRLRFVVERTTSWLNKFRRVAVRYDYKIEAYEAFVTLAMIRIVLRKFRNRRRIFRDLF